MGWPGRPEETTNILQGLASKHPGSFCCLCFFLAGVVVVVFFLVLEGVSRVFGGVSIFLFYHMLWFSLGFWPSFSKDCGFVLPI